jgi:hypothetical protein
MMEAPKMRNYILERTRGFFAGRPDEPCSGAARFIPADSGAALLRPAASTEAMRSLVCSGAVPPASTTAGVGPWPLSSTRET